MGLPKIYMIFLIFGGIMGGCLLEPLHSKDHKYEKHPKLSFQKWCSQSRKHVVKWFILLLVLVNFCTIWQHSKSSECTKFPMHIQNAYTCMYSNKKLECDIFSHLTLSQPIPITGALFFCCFFLF